MKLISRHFLFALVYISLLPSSGAAQEKIKIGVSVPLSGDAATYGEDIKNGVLCAAAALGNGIYDLRIEDDQCSEKGAVTVAQKLITVDNVAAVVGFGCSGALLGAAPVYERAKVVVLASATGAPAITQAGDYIFRTIPSLDVAAKQLFEHAASRYQTVGIISEESAYCQGLQDAFIQMNKAGAMKILTENFLPGTSDFRTQLTKLKATGVQALFVNPQTEAGLVTIVKQLRSLGWDVPLYGVYYPGSPTYLDAFGKGGDGIIYADLPFSEQMLNAAGMKGFQECLAKYGPPKSGDYNITLSYLAFSALHAALQHAPKDVKHYLYNNSFSGWVDKFSFDANGDVVSETITFVLKTIRDGRPAAVQYAAGGP